MMYVVLFSALKKPSGAAPSVARRRSALPSAPTEPPPARRRASVEKRLKRLLPFAQAFDSDSIRSVTGLHPDSRGGTGGKNERAPRAGNGKITVPDILSRKSHSLSSFEGTKQKITCLTAYDYPTARLLDEAGVDVLLVGDSLAWLCWDTTAPCR